MRAMPKIHRGWCSVARRTIGRVLLGRRIRLVVFCRANDGQLQSLTDGVVDVGYARTMTEDAAIGSVRDARTVAENAAGIRAVQ